MDAGSEVDIILQMLQSSESIGGSGNVSEQMQRIRAASDAEYYTGKVSGSLGSGVEKHWEGGGGDGSY